VTVCAYQMSISSCARAARLTSIFPKNVSLVRSKHATLTLIVCKAGARVSVIFLKANTQRVSKGASEPFAIANVTSLERTIQRSRSIQDLEPT